MTARRLAANGTTRRCRCVQLWPGMAVGNGCWGSKVGECQSLLRLTPFLATSRERAAACLAWLILACLRLLSRWRPTQRAHKQTRNMLTNDCERATAAGLCAFGADMQRINAQFLLGHGAISTTLYKSISAACGDPAAGQGTWVEPLSVRALSNRTRPAGSLPLPLCFIRSAPWHPRTLCPPPLARGRLHARAWRWHPRP